MSTKLSPAIYPPRSPASRPRLRQSRPQCWAKNALAQTLAAFDYQDKELFLAGMRHVQLEPVWGGSSDTAGPLRGLCALALVNYRSL